jgi:WD40 repeat protein
MKFRIVFFSLTLIILQTFNSCNKDPVAGNETCYNFDEGDCNIGVSGKTIGSDIRSLTFSKSNPNELVFQRKREDEDYQIVKYNLESKSELVLAEDVKPSSDFSCSKLGWIVFHTARSWKVWKLKDDGSELTQLTFTPRDLGPQFHPDGQKLIYARNYLYGIELDTNPELREKYKLMTIDLDGNAVDSFCRYYSVNDICYPWDQKFAAPDHVVKLYDLEGEEIESTFNFYDPISNISDIEWHPDGAIVFFTYTAGDAAKGNIMAWNTTNGDVSLIKKGCDSRAYYGISVSEDGKTIASVRVEGTYANYKSEYSFSPILIDIATGIEMELSLEQCDQTLTTKFIKL